MSLELPMTSVHSQLLRPASVTTRSTDTSATPRLASVRPDCGPAAVARLRLDRADECAWLGARKVTLAPKAFALLTHLAGHRGRLVTKDDLLDAVWPGVFVGDAVLKVAVREIRAALDDDAREPRFIQTVHRRGYRFVGDIEFVDARCRQPPRPPAVPFA